MDHYQWMTQEEFIDVLALENSLPGPITTKIAAIVGYNVASIPRMLIAKKAPR